jgi:hypothetical protein
MDTEKINSHLTSLGDLNSSMRAYDSHSSVNSAAAAVDVLDGGGLTGLAAELATPDTQRFGPLLYSLRQIYGQLAETRAMIDVPRLLDWADTVLTRIRRELAEPAPVEVAAAAGSEGAIPEGAKEFVIFESLAGGYRVACYSMGDDGQLFGLDGKPRVAPDPTKWVAVAYFKLPQAVDLIVSSALTLPGDEGLPDWSAAPPAPAAAATEGEATAIKIEGHAPILEFVPPAEASPVVMEQPAEGSPVAE